MSKNFDDNSSKNSHIDKNIENLENEKFLKNQWRKEIAESLVIQKHFLNYKQWSVDNFIDHYISEKYLIHTYGDMYKDILDRNRDQWIDFAHEALNAILQKKLFDKQCLWRAEEIVIKEIEIAYDFEIWENRIFECPFIEEITQHDIAMYEGFLSAIDTNIDELLNNDWQNYDDIKAAYANENDEFDEIPKWYEYNNTRTGNSQLLLLPDIRGQKESFYLGCHYAKHKAENPETLSDQQTENFNKPILESLNKKNIEYFINTFENKELQKKYQYYNAGNTYQNIDKERISELMIDILDIDEPIAIEANYNMLDAIQKAYNNYRIKKIIAHLPIAFEQYLFNKKMGFITRIDNSFNEGIRLTYKDNIIAGRLLVNEDGNLDF